MTPACGSTILVIRARASSSLKARVVKAVQAQLGHATASITLDTYGHLFPSGMETLANRLELVRDADLAGTDPRQPPT
jgi:integrase